MTQINEMELLKEIPGYKAILKSVIKTQIQILVEQLCEQGGEESIILTASINDGTLSHLGSSMGKGFFEGRDEIKSQFLGYCIKKYHSHDSQEGSQSRASFQKNYPSQRDQLGAPSPKRQKFQQSPVTSLKQEFEDQSMSDFSTSAIQATMSPRTDRVKAFPRKPAPGTPVKSIKTPISTPTLDHSNIPSSKTSAGVAAIKVEDTGESHGQDSDHMPMNDDATPITDDATALMNISQKVSLPSSVNLSHTQTFETTDEKDRSGATGNMSETVQFEEPSYETDIKEEPDQQALSGVEMAEMATGTPSDWDQSESEEGDWGQNVSGEMGYQAGLSGEDSMDQSGSRFRTSRGDLQMDFSMCPSPVKLCVCGFCGKTFSCHSWLERHIRIHTGQKDWVCQHCGKAFNRKDNFRIHVRSQHADTCNNCERKFRSKSDLERHFKVHTGQKEWICQYCSRAFSRKDNLKVHIWNKHTDQQQLK